MASLRLFGTETSPYVRRVRIVAAELGVDVTLIDTAVDVGQAALREVNPIWKVPTAVWIEGGEEEPILDSGVINARLMQRAGPGPLAPNDPLDVEMQNLQSVIDGALDSLINVFYLAKDGITADASYVAKQRARAESACRWLDARVHEDTLSGHARPHLVDIALGTTLAWMRFRATYPIENHPGLMRCLDRLSQRDSFEQTRPPGG